VINEMMPSPTGSDTSYEWFEIYNATSGPIDLRGFTIADEGVPDSHLIAGASAVNVAEGGYATLGINAVEMATCNVTLDYEYASFFIGNSGDEIILSRGACEVDRLVYSTNFDSEGVANSLRTDRQSHTENDLEANWCDAVTPMTGSCGTDVGTPGLVNDCP
jgi:hypothetical protein